MRVNLDNYMEQGEVANWLFIKDEKYLYLRV